MVTVLECLHTLFTSIILSHYILLTNISQMQNQNVVWVYPLDFSRFVHLIDGNIFHWQTDTKVIFINSREECIGKHSLAFVSAAQLRLKHSHCKNWDNCSSEILILGKEFRFLAPGVATHTFAKRVPHKDLWFRSGLDPLYININDIMISQGERQQRRRCRALPSESNRGEYIRTTQNIYTPDVVYASC